MTADRNTIEDAVDQAFDAFVYAPIGLLFDGPARFSTLVRSGRSQVNNARMLGPFAVQEARTRVQKAASGMDGPVLDLLRGLGVVPGPPPGPAPTATPGSAAAATTAAAPSAARPTAPAAKKAARRAAGGANDAKVNTSAATKAAKKRTAAVASATPSVDVLPISDYDSLSASQVVSRLRGLTPGQLDAIRAYETATRGRKTILNRVQQLSKQ